MKISIEIGIPPTPDELAKISGLIESLSAAIGMPADGDATEEKPEKKARKKPGPKKGSKKATKKAEPEPEDDDDDLFGDSDDEDEDESPAVTLDDLKAAMSAYIESTSVDDAKALLKKFKAKKLTDLPEDKWVEFVTAATAEE